jgi:hypothetical protein
VIKTLADKQQTELMFETMKDDQASASQDRRTEFEALFVSRAANRAPNDMDLETAR